MSICGLDFGTSNSTVSLLNDSNVQMVPLEQNPLSGQMETTLPSALFFDFEDDTISFGREAIAQYTDGDFGRLMRSMKNILGSSNMAEGTQVKATMYSFDDIIRFFIQSLKERTEAFAGYEVSSVVLGRPVHFNDDDAALDAEAESRLAAIAKSIGFKDVSFQFEPIAAAYDYEQQIRGEELALIIDMGGGTSDFTLMRLSPEQRGKADRTADILGHHGIHIGGTDFDRHLSLQTVMPHLGLGTPYKDKPNLTMPRHYYVDLATWHVIHRLYEPKVLRDIAELTLQAKDSLALKRMADVLKNKQGHRLAGLVEHAKIELSDSPDYFIDLGFIESASAGLAHLPVTQLNLEQAVHSDVERVIQAAEESLTLAGLKKQQVTTLFTTGGSTALPVVQKRVRETFPNANLVAGDLFNSVGAGLVLEAQRRYC
ncbi:Hsp70 family protein [Reinekea marinisedimentorum]|uniref:Putative chaperone protein n=1 Tax=Reinekea marinisedimentorum TaxID=230495 RepID=A0A4R3I3T7_9GAMM|nr:Hsp70 family protein [Reinekea marinisedimentorum]TCS39723.1 putative chaperone protein [Reinekea marinisedimentorum]